MLQNAPILSTFIKLPFDIKIFVSSILSGRFTQVLQVYVYVRSFMRAHIYVWGGEECVCG